MSLYVKLSSDGLQLTEVGRINGCCLSSRAIPQGKVLKRQLQILAGDCQAGTAFWLSLDLCRVFVTQCCSSKGDLSSLAREGTELGLEFPACCH